MRKALHPQSLLRHRSEGLPTATGVCVCVFIAPNLSPLTWMGQKQRKNSKYGLTYLAFTSPHITFSHHFTEVGLRIGLL